MFFGPTLAGIYAPGQQAVIAQAVLRLKYVCSLYCICRIPTMVSMIPHVSPNEPKPHLVRMLNDERHSLLSQILVRISNLSPAESVMP